MVEPVIAADGHTYEKAAIETWLQQHSVSPVTGDFLAHTRIVPNILIKSAIGRTRGCRSDINAIGQLVLEARSDGEAGMVKRAW